MLLKQNDSKIKFYCEINLYFDDNIEKHINVEEGDKVDITFKYNADTRKETGVIKQIIPINITNTDNCSYGCSCSCGCKSTAIIILDISSEFNSNTINILIGDILDITKIEE